MLFIHEMAKRLMELRSKAFSMAASGKHGDYPYDESFNDAVEEGFDDDGTGWTARDGTRIEIEKGDMPEKPSFSCYRVIRIDGTYDPERMDLEQARTAASEKVVSDALAHIHTVENGLQITDIADCGESL